MPTPSRPFLDELSVAAHPQANPGCSCWRVGTEAYTVEPHAFLRTRATGRVAPSILVRIQVGRRPGSCPICDQLQHPVMVVDHPLAAWQGIHDGINVVVEEPGHSLRILLGATDQTELLEQ